MASVLLGLGSNLGDRQNYINQAIRQITEQAGKRLTLSRIRETTPHGYTSDNPYLNAAAQIQTNLSPAALLTITQTIETTLGRTQKTTPGSYHDRVIDIDILLYDQLILRTPNLIIPHPRLHERTFVLQPLSEIAPHTIHPLIGKTIAELYRALQSP
jgi:2-amino-4-hydroxy-6-hydroxymethyldihydropteridine diphosphokinase